MIVAPNSHLPIISENMKNFNKDIKTENRCFPWKTLSEVSTNLTLASGLWRRVKIGSGWAFE